MSKNDVSNVGTFNVYYNALIFFSLFHVTDWHQTILSIAGVEAGNTCIIN